VDHGVRPGDIRTINRRGQHRRGRRQGARVGRDLHADRGGTPRDDGGMGNTVGV